LGQVGVEEAPPLDLALTQGANRQMLLDHDFLLRRKLLVQEFLDLLRGQMAQVLGESHYILLPS
jgi:hypothetical protein